MIRAIRSYLSGLRASSLFGRARRLRDAGRKEEALSVARQSLAELHAPWVARRWGTEGSVLVCATILVEQVASELNQPGADSSDLSDALALLKSLPPGATPESFEGSIPYLEARLNFKGHASAA